MSFRPARFSTTKWFVSNAGSPASRAWPDGSAPAAEQLDDGADAEIVVVCGGPDRDRDDDVVQQIQSVENVGVRAGQRDVDETTRQNRAAGYEIEFVITQLNRLEQYLFGYATKKVRRKSLGVDGRNLYPFEFFYEMTGLDEFVLYNRLNSENLGPRTTRGQGGWQRHRHGKIRVSAAGIHTFRSRAFRAIAPQ